SCRCASVRCCHGPLCARSARSVRAEQRNSRGEARAGSRRRFDVEAAYVRADDLRADVQPETEAFAARGYRVAPERLEDACKAFRRNRRSAIGDLDHEFGIVGMSGKIYRMRGRTVPKRVRQQVRRE